MSNRRARVRAPGRSYTARLRRPPAGRSPRTWPTWLAGPRLPAVLGIAAESGHLVAAVIEWPAAVPRGIFHIAAASVLGVLAIAVYFGASPLQLGFGLAIALVLPACWLVGAGAGVSPYRDYPPVAAAALTLAELALATLIAVHLAATATPMVPARTGAGRRPTATTRH